MNKRLTELFAATAFGILFAVLFFEGIGYSGRSAYMPTAATGIGFLMCCFWGLKVAIKKPVVGSEEKTNIYDVSKSDIIRFSLLLVAVAIYIIGFAWLGFFTSTIIMVPGLAAALGYRNWKVLITSTICFVFVLYIVFKLLLSVPLPKEAILTLLGG